MTTLGISLPPLHHSTRVLGCLGPLGPLLRLLPRGKQRTYGETKPHVFCTRALHEASWEALPRASQ